MHFLDFWLPLVGCTISGIVYESFRRQHLVRGVELVSLLVFEALVFILWATYWIWLYPTYLTPLKSLPTPPERKFPRGNHDEFLPANAWYSLEKIARTVPNDGIVRYYGPLNMERLLLTSPKALKDALVVNGYDFEPSSLIKLAAKRFTGSKYTELSHAEIKAHKKYISPAFTVPHAKELAPTFFSTAVRMVHAIDRTLQANAPWTPVPLDDFIERASLDNIGIGGMGYDFNTIDNPENEDFAIFQKLSIKPTPLFSWLEMLSHYIHFKWLLHLPFRKNLEVLNGARAFRQLAERVIRNKQARLVEGKCSEDEKRDIVSVALASGAMEPGIMTDYMMTYIQGGQETTAATFSWAMFELGRRPEIQQRLREEVRDRLGSSLETTGGGNITDLPFLSAICNETLRLHPMLPVMIKEAVRDTTISGQPIPRGTCITYSAYVTNRDPELWGPTAAEFDPERWLKPGAARSGGASTNYAMLTFGHGPRSCIGQNIARVSLPCFIASVVGRYRIELTSESAAGRVKFGLKNVPESVWAKLTPIEGW